MLSNLFNAASGINSLEQMAEGDSGVHGLHPMAKVLTTVLYVIAVISFNPLDVSGLMPYIFYPALLMPLSGIPMKFMLPRLLAALPFSLAGGISNLIFMRGTAFVIGGVAVSTGAVYFASIMLKTILTVFAVLILIATTSFTDISAQLRFLHVPKLACIQFLMTYRYLTVLIDEAATMYTAYSLRAPGQKGIMMRDMGVFLGQLILRGFDRAERVYTAMKCRGFEGEYNGRNRRGIDRASLVYSIFLGAGIVIFRFVRLF